MGKIRIGGRPWLKLRLSANLLAHTVAAIVERWKGEGKAAGNVALAIALFDELQRGETGMLQAQFPWLMKGSGVQPLHKVYEMPVLPAAEFEMVEMSEADLEANFMKSLGL